MATIYEMTQQAAALYELLATMDEFDEQAFTDTLEAVGANDKVNSYCQIINQFEADINSIEAEIDRLKGRKEMFDRNIGKMKTALQSFLDAAGQGKIKTDLFTVSSRKSESVKIFDETVIPQEYIKSEVKTSPMKAEIKKAIKSGIKVPGAELVQGKNLQIK